MQILQNFPDLDKILSGLVTSPKTITAKTARIAIDTVINLRQTIKMAATLSDCLKFVDQNQIIEAIIENCRAPVLQDILNDIDNLITESTIPAKSVKDMKYQECFALRNGLDGLLDVARKTFLQMVEDLHMVIMKIYIESSFFI